MQAGSPQTMADAGRVSRMSYRRTAVSAIGVRILKDAVGTAARRARAAARHAID